MQISEQNNFNYIITARHKGTCNTI